MDQSYTESDVSLSPSQILERLQVLRQLQLLQRGKLQKQRLEYQESSEISSSITEIVSHFSNSTSYNTFRSLLETPHDSSNDGTPRVSKEKMSPKVKERDLIDGISVLNLSQESEFIVNSPTSTRSRVSASSRNGIHSQLHTSDEDKNTTKKVISLDDMPILSPKKDFEELVLEKLQINEVLVQKKSPNKQCSPTVQQKRPFLRRGQGTSRFGLQKKDFIIQNTKSLPWRQKSLDSNKSQAKSLDSNKSQATAGPEKPNVNNKKNVGVEILVTKSQKKETNIVQEKKETETENRKSFQEISNTLTSSTENSHEPPKQSVSVHLELPKGKHPLSKGKTWASVLTKEQNDFLRQLKQSDYYKNFASPAKSSVSDASCDEALLKIRHEREIAEQNMFDLLEKKVSHESFTLENSFFNKFLRKNKLECSGESTPIVMQHCLANNPSLMHIYPDINQRKRNDNSHSECEYTDCCSETCSSVSSCCSCKTIEESKNSAPIVLPKKVQLKEKEVVKPNDDKENDNIIDNDNMKANMVEMNAKLIATSELLKERLRELEDEIETFRQENSSLTKMREEIDTERQKLYEEKNMFEQKFNEEKILSEYYLAEEKEKLTKQKQVYERYVREMRGRLNKKDKDEVVNLKKEINNLKEEIRLRDAKTTTTIARLRNQIKIMEKEKKDFQAEIEKLKKENRRLQHSNDMTRRMTNIKYLEEINKKLSNMTAKETKSEINLDSNAKYKTFEIESQTKSKRFQAVGNKPLRTRAKSVPNLKVTSRYAKYFSQRDVLSDMERNQTVSVEPAGTYTCPSDNEESENERNINDDLIDCNDSSDKEDDNNLEKLYVERFGSTSARSSRSNLSDSNRQSNNFNDNPDTFFIQKGNTNKDSKSPRNTNSPFDSSAGSNLSTSKSPVPVFNHRPSSDDTPINGSKDCQIRSNSVGRISNTSQTSSKYHNPSRSPISILTNRSSSSQRPETIIHKEQYRSSMNVSPEPVSSRTNLAKTNLNPIEIKKPDGSRELRFPNGNVKMIAPDGKYSKFIYYNGDIKENFYNEGRIKYYYAESKTFHTTYADGLEVLEFPDGQVEKRYKDGSSEIRLPNGSVRYFDPKNQHVREEWRFPDGAALTVSASGEQRVVFPNGQVEVHAKDHKRREFPDGTVKLVYNDGTAETRYASGRVRIKDKHGNLIMDSAPC